MTILGMLDKLAMVAPDVCQKKSYSDGPTFVIGRYSFWYDSLDNFQAYTSVVATGRPALAWLADAIMGECEKRGWDYDILYDASLKPAQASHWAGIEGGHRLSADTQAEALLAAFLAVMEGKR